MAPACVSEENEMNAQNVSLLQATILRILAGQDGKLSGIQLRDELKSVGINKSGANFYQVMFRLEKQEYIKSFDHNIIVNKRLYKQKQYEITPHGKSVLHDYMKTASQVLQLGFGGST